MAARTGASTSGTPKKPICGAKGRTCLCGHHGRKAHAKGGGKCQEKGCKCKAFRPKPCGVDRLFPNGRCRSHGGKTPAGPASTHFRHGKYSKLLPKDLAKHYEAALLDPELVSVREELALLDARSVQILEQLQAGDAGALWRQLKAAGDRLLAARQAKNTEALGVALEEVLQTIAGGTREANAWADLLAVTELRRKLVETQSRREKDLQQNVAISELMVLMGRIARSVAEHVKDPAAVAAVTMDLRKLIGTGAVIDAEPVAP